MKWYQTEEIWKKPQPKEEPVSYRNHEQYPDPTAFLAIRNIVREEEKRLNW